MMGLNRKFVSVTLLFLMAVSFFGLAIAVFFVVNPPAAQEDFELRKPAVGSALSAICILGVLAVLYPQSCAGIAGLKKQGETVHGSGGASGRVLRGHHVDCAPYSTHVIHVGNSVFCATCSGLLVGAVIVLACTGLFFFGNLRLAVNPFIPVAVGAAGVISGLLYPAVPVRFQRGSTRFLAGVLLAAGSFLVVAGVEKATGSFSLDFFVVALSVLWLATKMSMSQWEHKKTCAQCSIGSCSAKMVT